MFDQKGRFIVEDYSRKSTFASFLPGICGEMGIPIWCFYVNRGQAIASFGSESKLNSIMEFYPAHQSYQKTPTNGFRTFMRVKGDLYEPFRDDLIPKMMYIGMNELEIEECCSQYGIRTNVLYFTIPEEPIGALVRKVTITNTTTEDLEIELLDGMPYVLPYGLNTDFMKSMGQTMKAWMQVEDVDTKLPYYRLRASTSDVTEIEEIVEGNFYFTLTDNGEKLPVIVDPEVVFEYDTSLNKPIGFLNHSIEELYAMKQVVQNNVPCSFFGKRLTLSPGESYCHYAMIGKVERKDILRNMGEKCSRPGYFEEKYERARSLTEELCKVIDTKTASNIFDAYCKNIFMDNFLRGGYPILLGNDKVYYIYSRKHGDLERDYNFFYLLPEYYSQGNAAFRDVNQNRRCDTLFWPYVKDYNIKLFYNLIQIDGYNPLSVLNSSFTVNSESIEEAVAQAEDGWDELRQLLTKPYTPGSLLKFVEQKGIRLKGSPKEFLDHVVSLSETNINAEFGEGYWCDHWTYNLDLVEAYLAVYPDKEKSLLYDDDTYTYFESKVLINPRIKRYTKTNRGVRQYNALDVDTKKDVLHNELRTNYGEGDVYRSNLMTKMVIMAINKFAALDPYGMGIEMEGGRPGWYDALNGLPGLFGSSMAETYELSRLLDFLIRVTRKYGIEVAVPIEIADYIEMVNSLLSQFNQGQLDNFDFWNEVNNTKETFRDTVQFGIEGTTENIDAPSLLSTLKSWQSFVKDGINKAIQYGKGMCPTYFSYELSEYEETKKGIIPKKFDVVVMPYFLEGPVRYMKLDLSHGERRDMYHKVKSSNLYDKKLKMYKCNESLADTSFEIGRAKAFTPGWLENESIFLHMEYKYLLELLKRGLYHEFFEDFGNAAIPFLDQEVYGRSLLENSSFIASSANPNERLHGKGFIARLSGSTAEFVNMWILMMFGSSPFYMEGDQLVLELKPALPKYLVGSEKKVECTFLGKIHVIYKFNKEEAVAPGDYRIEAYDITYKDGSVHRVTGPKIKGSISHDIRDLKVKELSVEVNIF